jgi:hypothetical protein
MQTKETSQQAIKDRLALYTTFYPNVEGYLSAWYDSVLKQTDTEFDVWIGLDGIPVKTATSFIGEDFPVNWVSAAQGDTPVQIRQKAIEDIVKRYPAVIFVDSDDLLESTRVEAARKSLESNDVSGCAMRLIDENNTDLSIIFRLPDEIDIDALLPGNNVFGMSNTAYRSELLSRCLPVPAQCVLMDWFLITRAWALGVSFDFDSTPRMAYRQHPSNITRVLPPFTPEQVFSSTELVINHHALVLNNIPELQDQYRIAVESASKYVLYFYKTIVGSTDILKEYVKALNQLQLSHIWWECVAHPRLEYIWRTN